MSKIISTFAPRKQTSSLTPNYKIMEFFYLRKRVDKGEQTLRAIKYNGNYYPIDNILNNKMFVYGVGWINAKRKIYELPHFNGNESDFANYLKQYGQHVLYYSISGESLNWSECRKMVQHNEFASLCAYGAIGHTERVVKFRQMEDMQRAALAKLFDKSEDDVYSPKTDDATYKGTFGWLDNFKDYDVIFQPTMSIMGIAPLRMSVNPMEDDEKLNKVYRRLRRVQLVTAHPLYKEYCDVHAQVKEMRLLADNYYDVKEREDTLYETIRNDINEQLNKELHTDNDQFPTSVKDRMIFLYGEDVAKTYEEFLKIAS